MSNADTREKMSTVPLVGILAFYLIAVVAVLGMPYSLLRFLSDQIEAGELHWDWSHHAEKQFVLNAVVLTIIESFNKKTFK